ncbi:MAG: T9SS type A sorting domain-containing protein [Lewinellaceae bacterium]|nr:T9SS type A sorting domain-containing protein [Lewinellaceae bacterium]
MKTKTLCFVLLMAFGLFAGTLRAQGTFTETHTIDCGDTLTIGSLGYPTWNDPHIIQPPKWGFARLLGDFAPPNILEYQAPPCFVGMDTLVIECAHATQITCDTGIYIFNVVCFAPFTTAFTYQINCNDSLYTGNLSGWFGPQISAGPNHGMAKIIFEPTDGAGVKYIPEPNFEGLDYVKVTTTFGDFLYLFQVSCTASSVTEKRLLPMVLSPNPAQQFVQITGPERLEEVWIFDQLGRIMPAQITNGNVILLNGYPAGVYQILATDGKQLFSGRLVKMD